MNELRNELANTCRRLYDRGLVAGTDGNISVRVPMSSGAEEAMLITPSGVNKGDLRAEQLLLQEFSGKVLEGTLRSSKEAKLHIRIYKERPDIAAVVHTHPPFATAFAACGKTVPNNVLIEAEVLLGKMGLAPYAEPGSQALVDSLDGLLEECNVFFLQNHGVIVCGPSLQVAFDRMDALENLAKSIVFSHLLGGPVLIPEAEIQKIREKKT